jgi:hypothetical protein
VCCSARLRSVSRSIASFSIYGYNYNFRFDPSLSLFASRLASPRPASRGAFLPRFLPLFSLNLCLTALAGRLPSSSPPYMYQGTLGFLPPSLLPFPSPSLRATDHP